MAQEDAPAAAAEPLGGQHEFLLAQREHGTATEARVGGDRHQADGEQGVAQARADHRHDRDGQQGRRKRQHDVHAEHHDQVDLPSKIAGQKPERRADHGRHRDGAHREAQRHPGRVENTDEDVAAEAVGAERVRPRLGLEAQREIGIDAGVVHVDGGRDARDEQHGDDDDEPRPGRRARHEPAPGGRGRARPWAGHHHAAIQGGLQRRHSYLMRGSTAA